MTTVSSTISRWCFRLILTVLLLAPAGAYAGRAAEFDAHVARAEQHVTAERYDQAIMEFEAAYSLKPEAWLLINLGRAHFRSHRPREALNFYDRALKGNLTQRERVEVLASAAKAQKELDEQRERDAAEQRRIIAEQQAAQEARLKAMEINHRPEKKPFYKTGWFWGTVGGVTVTAVLVGLFVARPWEHPDPMLPPMPGDMEIVLR